MPADTLAYLALSRARATRRRGGGHLPEPQYSKGLPEVHGFPHAPYADILSEDDVGECRRQPVSRHPQVARFGYDGKGQARVKDKAEALAAFRRFSSEPCVMERMLPLDHEVSVVLARNEVGRFETASRRPRTTIGTAFSTSPSSRPVATRLLHDARENGRGDRPPIGLRRHPGRRIFRRPWTALRQRMAPRPHNSGHSTIDACILRSVRTTGARPLRPATGRCPVSLGGGDGQLLGDLWYRDATRPRPRTKPANVVGRAQPQAASLRQASCQAGAEDGPLHGTRRRPDGDGQHRAMAARRPSAWGTTDMRHPGPVAFFAQFLPRLVQVQRGTWLALRHRHDGSFGCC